MFNQRILQQAIENSGRDLLDGEVQNVHKLLTDDDVTSETQKEAQTWLHQQEIDIEELRNDFVTYQQFERI